ncbi:MAG: hypothetical protein CAPSK01_002075 [Candidatus Accumulibacter vicinus]|uniref:Uncharacterized protein n=1 Tax=Candidatus Accumulibacter vicinus TaxID=2954382 RepID=A0A084Y0H8_9PROT|nr:MAG: hypothetical protein CAPSK01_002075 [Candidatus Accumulibacter vicinus]
MAAARQCPRQLEPLTCPARAGRELFAVWLLMACPIVQAQISVIDDSGATVRLAQPANAP